MAEEDRIPGVVSLTTANFRQWLTEVTIHLQSQNLFEIVTGEETPPEIPAPMTDFDLLTNHQKIEWCISRGITNCHTGGGVDGNGDDIPLVVNNRLLAATEPKYQRDQERRDHQIEKQEALLLKYKKRKAKARGILYKSVSPAVRLDIADIVDPHEAWNKLSGIYNKSTDDAYLMSLRKKLKVTYRFPDSIDEYCANWTTTKTQLAQGGWHIEEKELNFQLYDNLESRELDSYLQILNFKMKEKTYTNEQLVCVIRDDINEMLRKAELHTANRTSTNYNKKRNRSSSPRRDSRKKNRDRSPTDKEDKPNKTKKCNHCNKKGHLVKDCYIRDPSLREKKQADNDRKQYEYFKKKLEQREKEVKTEKKKSTSTDVLGTIARMTHTTAIDLEEEQVAFVEGPLPSYNRSLIDWNTDSACSNHMGCNRDFFDFINPLTRPVWVTVGNGEQIEAKGLGDVTLLVQKSPAFTSRRTGKSYNRKAYRFTFKNVLYVPGLMANLISCLQMAKVGLTSVILGRKTTDRNNSPLKGAVLDAETNELLFTMTHKDQQYCLDVIPDFDRLNARYHQLVHDDNIAEKILSGVESAQDQILSQEESVSDSSDTNSEMSSDDRSPDKENLGEKEDEEVSMDEEEELVNDESDTHSEMSCDDQSTDQEGQQTKRRKIQSYASSSDDDSHSEIAVLDDSDEEELDIADQNAFAAAVTQSTHHQQADRSCPHEHCIETAAFEIIWHHRLAHPHSSVLKAVGHSMDFKDANMLTRPTIHREAGCCSACATGKARRKSKDNSRVTSVATDVLDMVCIDTVGPISPSIISRDTYFTLFADDFSRYLTIGFSKTKMSALDQLEDYRQRNEGLTGKRLRRIRTDRGNEFFNSKGLEYFAKTGIDNTMSAAYTKRQNGKIERHIQTILNKTRCLMHTSGSDKRFWKHAMAYAVYIHNRLPHSALPKRQSPYERWNGFKPDLSIIRVWGCDAYVFSNKDLQKLDHRTTKHIFLGIEGDSPNYILYNPTTHNLTVSNNVHFNEARFSAMEAISKINAIGLDIGKGTVFFILSQFVVLYCCQYLVELLALACVS